MTHRIFLCLIFFIFSSYSLAENPELNSLLEKASFQKGSKTEKKDHYFTFYTHVFNTLQRIKPLCQKTVVDRQTTVCRVLGEGPP